MVFIYIVIKLLLLNKHFDDVDKENNSTLVTVFSVFNSTVFFVYYFKTHNTHPQFSVPQCPNWLLNFVIFHKSRKIAYNKRGLHWEANFVFC